MLMLINLPIGLTKYREKQGRSRDFEKRGRSISATMVGWRRKF